MVEERLAAWAAEVGDAVSPLLRELRPDAVVTSLFGVEAVAVSAPGVPWGVINSTFYLGPNPPRPLELDAAPRAQPLLARYARLLGLPSLVLHATDQVFDLGFDGLPARHHYTGPLGIWEPPGTVPAYLAEPGDPWVLVSLSSQAQDDLPLARAAVEALADKPLRAVVTVGRGHEAEEVGAVPGHIHVEQLVPHAAVLRRADLLLSHAGHGLVMKGLWEARPMVLVPWGRDQPGVAARAEMLGVAAVVAREEVSAAMLSAAIDRVIASQPMHAAVAAHSARLQETDPPAAAASLLETLL